MTDIIHRAILQDEELYGPGTNEFRPERFLTEDGSALNEEVPFPDNAFGFGRRVCPGKSTAYTFLLITAASILQCYNIRKAKDADGNDIEPTVRYQTGIIRCLSVPPIIRVYTMLIISF